MTINVSLVVYYHCIDTIVGSSIGVFQFPIQLCTLA